MRVGLNFKLLGEVIKENAQYTLTDNKHLDKLIVSETKLNPYMSTNGHKHDNIEEVYIFTKGQGIIQLGEGLVADIVGVTEGTIISIKGGIFHKVSANDQGLGFISIFEKYTR